MKSLEINKKDLNLLGFSVINNVYNKFEIQSISNLISNLNTSNPIFRKTDDLFAIRQFIKEFPEIKKLLFNERLKEIVKTIGGEDYFIVKSIYFDKPEKSNWFVSYHQDLTISVDKKIEDENFQIGPISTINLQYNLQLKYWKILSL
jgi:hypothetical protein